MAEFELTPANWNKYMSRARRRIIKERARRIQKIAREQQKDTTKDYLQYTLVVLIILLIIAGAIYFTQT